MPGPSVVPKVSVECTQPSETAKSRAAFAAVRDGHAATVAVSVSGMEGAVDHIQLLLTRQLYEVRRVAGNTHRQLRITLRFLHGIDQRLAVEHINVDVVTVLREVAIEHRKITWPDRRQIVRETWSVIFLVSAITVMVLGIDWVLGHVIFGPLEHWARIHGAGVGRG